MADPNGFAKDFLRLLKKSKLTRNYKLKEVLQQHHTVITAINNEVLALVARHQNTQELAQGLRGGGGPHRLDLVLHFSTDAGEKTLATSQDLLRKFL